MPGMFLPSAPTRIPNGVGPHFVISEGEIAATLVVLGLAFVAFVWMAWNTRITVDSEHTHPLKDKPVH